MNASNVFLETYYQLEEEALQLTYDIAFDDNQLNAYSNHIADLILAISIEIESISKYIYWKNGGTKAHPHFDYDCVDGLSGIENKAVIIISPKVKYSKPENQVIFPFRKTDHKDDQNRTPIYPWNNAYQNLKHDKVNKWGKFGTQKYLVYALAAYYLLLFEAEAVPNSHFYSVLDERGGYCRPSSSYMRKMLENNVMQFYLSARITLAGEDNF